MIRSIRAWEVLDSRGRPTVAARCELANGIAANASVPSGASTGKHEAHELRDGDPARYRGLGVQTAVANINNVIAPALIGLPAKQRAIDRHLCALDGTPNKSRLGANALLAVSCAVARAAARQASQPLWQWLAADRTPRMPVPMINILSGGLHAGRNIEFQDFLVIPHGIDTYPAQLEAVVAVHHAAFEVLKQHGCQLTGVADEGGWGPLLSSNETALQYLVEAIERAGFAPGRQVSLAIDAAATHFFRNGVYDLETEARRLTSEEMVELLATWCARYPIVSIEDGLAEDDWTGWRLLTERLGAQVQLIGDDLFTTNLQRLQRGLTEHVANAVLVKMNQIGTLTETLAVLDRAHEAGYRAVVSARSGETEDSFLADLAVASGAGSIKVGSITRSERLAKYNRLLEIEHELAEVRGGRR